MWLPVSLIAALLFAITSFLDKYLLNNVTRNFSAAAYVSLASIAGLPIGIVLFLFARSSLAMYSFGTVLAALGAGFLMVSSYYLYYRCLEKADTSFVSILYQSSVVFNLIFGWFFLHEHIDSVEIVGIIFILAGTTLLNIEFVENKLKFKTGVFIPMIVASILASLADVTFKHTALDTNFVGTQFFAYFSITLAGLVIFFLSPKIRMQLKGFIQAKNKPLKISAANEAINAGGMLLVNSALLLGPIALVQAAVSVEALFAVLIGLLLTSYFPKIIKENVKRGHVMLKIASCLIIIFGVALIH